MTASLLGCTLLLLFVLDIFSPANKAETEISNSLERYEEHLSMYFSNTAGQGIRLAGIAAVKSGAASKTNIHEIDDLLEFLARQGAAKNGSNADIDMSAFYAFKENISTLSRAEKSVFNLYMEGHAAPEIAETLNISINTVKTHNKNIYRKLNVTSREALLVYAQMMKGGRE